LKIAFATLFDLNDINRGSGTYHTICNNLNEKGHIVYKIQPVNLKFPFLTKFFRFISKRIFGMRYRSYQDPFIARVIGNEVKQLIQDLDYDILLTNDYSIAGYTESDKPIILWTDAVFPYNYSQNQHPWLENLPWFCVKFCQSVVKRALNNINLLFVPSEWSKKKISEYDIIENHLMSVLPFGSNLDDPGSSISQSRDFNKIVNKREIRFLFVGKYWLLKGGDIAVRTVKELNKMNIRSTLDIIGIENDNNYYVDDNDKIIFHGFIDKNDIESMKKMISLYKRSDIFILPSIAEGFGISYMEAASFGLPSLGFKTMGVTTAVRMDKSGVLIELNDNPDKFIDIIINWIKNPYIYNQLVSNSRIHYEKNGNWNFLTSSLINEIDKFLRISYN
tara:strand:- start:19 stop:1191 length:1173 start_codon:yes stop_codon:yes gene_type:complete